MKKIDRRLFIKNSTLAAAALTLGTSKAIAGITSPKNALPRWKGFNLLDYFSPSIPKNGNSDRTTDDDFKMDG